MDTRNPTILMLVHRSGATLIQEGGDYLSFFDSALKSVICLFDALKKVGTKSN